MERMALEQESNNSTLDFIFKDFFLLFLSHSKYIFVLFCSGNLVLYSFATKSF